MAKKYMLPCHSVDLFCRLIYFEDYYYRNCEDWDHLFYIVLHPTLPFYKIVCESPNCPQSRVSTYWLHSIPSLKDCPYLCDYVARVLPYRVSLAQRKDYYYVRKLH